jgi:BirA family biotin operon repressor/biotin-[acetyl-CoA-carboxylase] ligase
MTAEQTIGEAVREAGIGDAPVRFDDVTESTNTTALRLATEGAPEWSVVVAGHQTGGRGRLGRTWVSEPGQALLCSVVLRPEGLSPDRAGLLTLLAGVAMVEAARVGFGVTAGCKWPNDIMVGEKKAGGLLAESLVEDGRLSAVVIGAGVNVAAAPADMRDATALGVEGDDPSKLLTSFLFCLKQRYAADSADFARTVAEAYRPLCVTFGRSISATTTDGRTIEGVATDIDDQGNLLVEVGGRGETVAFGEIAHLSR